MGVSICPPIDADSIHRLTLVPENATGPDKTYFFFAGNVVPLLPARPGPKKKKKKRESPPVKDDRQKRIIILELNKVVVCSVYIHMYM